MSEIIKTSEISKIYQMGNQTVKALQSISIKSTGGSMSPLWGLRVQVNLP
jgi:ABC-type lipoprotein export system ATPase subunit